MSTVPFNPTLNDESFTKLRHGRLDQLVDMLKAQHDVKYDAVVPAESIAYSSGLIAVRDAAVAITDEGVEARHAWLNPTDRCERLVSAKLGIPSAYVDKLRAFANAEDGDHGALLDHNMNTWLHQDPDKRWLLRGFRTDDPGEVGVARALLSDSYKMIDNYDVLFAALDAIHQAGVAVEVTECNLSETKMRVRVEAPQITAIASTWLGNYRSPWGQVSRRGDGTVEQGEVGSIVRAGIIFENSETGGSAFKMSPQVVVLACKNGMTVSNDVLRRVHLGADMSDGVVRYSDETMQRNIDLVASQTKDAVTTFLDRDYIEAKVAEIEGVSGKPVKASDAPKVIERVTKPHRISEEQQKSILDCFMASGDMTAGGICNAVTAAAQTMADPDAGGYLEDRAFAILNAV